MRVLFEQYCGVPHSSDCCRVVKSFAFGFFLSLSSLRIGIGCFQINDNWFLASAHNHPL